MKIEDRPFVFSIWKQSQSIQKTKQYYNLVSILIILASEV